MSTSGEQPGSITDPAEWLDRHGDALYQFTLSRLRDAEAAEEVVQETFVAALGARDQYSGRGSEGAWLLGICKRKVVDHVRGRNRPDAGVGGDLGPDPSEAMFDAKGNWRFDPRVLKGRPERALEREEFWQAFRGCLQRLSQRQADAFIHFAIVCASIGCPRLLNHAYTPEHLESQLVENTRDFFARQTNFQVDLANRKVRASSILDWFGEDFGPTSQKGLAGLAKYVPDAATRKLIASADFSVSYLDYDWSLNKQ